MIQINKTTAEYLGIKPDKDGFYYSKDRTIKLSQHQYLTDILASEKDAECFRKLIQFKNEVRELINEEL